MSNPFPSDWSLASPKEQPALPAGPPLALLRNRTVYNSLNYCSQILSSFSLDSSSPSSPPALESGLSTRDSSSPPSPITPITPGGKRYTTSATAYSTFLPFSPRRTKRQRSDKEMRTLSDSQLGLQLAIILSEEQLPQDRWESLPPFAPPAAASSRPSPQSRRRMVLRHSEGPFGDAIPHLDLDAVQEADEEGDDAWIGGCGGGAEAPAAAAPQAEVPGEVVRLNAAGSRRSRSELAKYAGRSVAPRDLLFL